MPGHGHSIAAINVVEPVNAPEVFRIGLVRADRFEAADDRSRDARRIGELAPAGQGYLRRPQAFDRPSAAIAVKDFRPDEEWFRHGPMRLLSIDCSRSAKRVVVLRQTIRRYHKLVSMLEQ